MILIIGASGNVGRHLVEELTGTPGRTFREWTVDHADSFR